MTKDDLAGEVSKLTGLTRKETTAAINAIIEVISRQLCEGKKIYLRGFGCFETKLGRGRRARNPQGYGLINIPPRIRPVFRPYDELKEQVRYNNAQMVPVDFLYLDGKSAVTVCVVGSFNSWKNGASPMEKLPDGSWVTEIVMPSGQSISYMYNIDGKMITDPVAPTDSRGFSVKKI